MKKFEERKFKIPKLKGISEKNIDEHLRMDLPKESYMFQFGYTTNNLSE